MRNEQTIDTSKRMVAIIMESEFVKGRGYRACFVVEGEDTYRPTGVWPNDGTETMPWFWGTDLDAAKKRAVEYNLSRGISEREAAMIVTRSMFGGGR